MLKNINSDINNKAWFVLCIGFVVVVVVVVVLFFTTKPKWQVSAYNFYGTHFTYHFRTYGDNSNFLVLQHHQKGMLTRDPYKSFRSMI